MSDAGARARTLQADGRTSLLLYSVTIFLGAFLLFQVQPLIGKYVLPWFGGSAGVWAATLLFFQVALLIGYGYAHASATWLGPRGQSVLHLGLLGLALLALPIIPSASLRPEGADDPVRNIVLLLALTVGAPYLLLAANGPLLQSWFARQHPGRSPYRLYALSNVASLTALLSYPLLFERVLHLGGQAWLWSGAFAAFVVLCGALAVQQLRMSSVSRTLTDLPAAGDASTSNAASKARASQSATPEARSEGLHPGRIVLWLVLPAIASAMLLATTNRLTQEIAPVPMLWVLPLSVYLVSFILTFDSDRWYQPQVYIALLLAVLLVNSLALSNRIALSLIEQTVLLHSTLFLICMVCHGEVVAMRPGARHLTLFYLTISAGGALGGAAVALGAPIVFDNYWEFNVGLIVVAAAVSVLLYLEFERSEAGARRTIQLVSAGVALTITLFIGRSVGQQMELLEGDIVATRGFYGALRVQPVNTHDESIAQYQLVHGQTLHGLQFLAPERRREHTTYYADDSGIGLALRFHPARAEGEPLRMGFIGLGTGTLAGYAEAGDYLRYYEINPEVLEIAEEHFTYLADARARGADVDVPLGDARLVMERQLEDGEPQRFDVMAVDAFSSDSIPIHLLTREAFEVYRQHLAPGGVIAVHVSNRYLDLSPVVRRLAEDAGMEAKRVAGRDDTANGINRSEWILVTDNAPFLATREVDAGVIPWPDGALESVLWTDDYSALLPLLQF